MVGDVGIESRREGKLAVLFASLRSAVVALVVSLFGERDIAYFNPLHMSHSRDRVSKLVRIATADCLSVSTRE